MQSWQAKTADVVFDETNRGQEKTAAQREVGKAIKKTEAGTQKSGNSGKAKNTIQAIAIGLSKVREKGAKVPAKKS